MTKDRICLICGKFLIRPKERRKDKCNACHTKIRRYITKENAIKYLGGECKRCTWSGHQAGFEFHHQVPSEKDFAIASVANKSWNSIKEELEKCVLLCSICHRIEHSNRASPEFMKAVEKFIGFKL